MAVLKVAPYRSAVVWNGTNAAEVVSLVTLYPCVVKSNDGHTLVVTVDFGTYTIDVELTVGQYAISDSGDCISSYSPADFAIRFYQLP